MKKIIAIVSGLTIGLLGAATAFATDYTEINTCGYQITQPGRYKVMQNLVCSQQAPYVGIMISNVQSSNKVELDLNGYTLRGNNGQGIGIFIIESRNIEIHGSHNSRIERFETGIQLWKNNQKVDVDGDGLQLRQNRTGVLLRNSEDIKLKELKMQFNTADVVFSNAKDVEVRDFNQ